jgi:hypothetical protein
LAERDNITERACVRRSVALAYQRAVGDPTQKTIRLIDEVETM